MSKEKRFYVYEWYNVDSGEVFYVGKGTGTRYKQVSDGASRNNYFKNYHKKHDCDVRLVAEKLSNKNALIQEAERILFYRKIGQCKTNLTDGGENPPALSGEKNGMFGKTHSKETRDIMSRKHKAGGKFKGNKNPQFGVSPKDRMDKKTYAEWRKKQKARKFGETNPNYGNKKLSRFYKEHPEISKEKNSRKGVKNGRATPIAMFNEIGFYQEFDYMTLCAKYIISKEICRAKNTVGVQSKISSAAKNKTKYLGYNFKFI